MQMTQEKVHPMTVVTIANARVHDLIGLICWQYTSEGREPKLKWAQTQSSLLTHLKVMRCWYNSKLTGKVITASLCNTAVPQMISDVVFNPPDVFLGLSLFCKTCVTLLFCVLLLLSTVRTWRPTACTLLRTMVRWTLTSHRWTQTSQSTSLASALWHWWRNIHRQGSFLDSHCLSECKLK